MYFDHVVLSPNSSRVLPTSLPFNFMASFSLKKKNATTTTSLQNKQAKRQNSKIKQNKAKCPQRYHRIHFVLANYSGHRAYPGIQLVYPVTLYWRTLTFLLPAGTNCR